MVRDWLKSIFREVFDEDIKRIGCDYVDKKIGDTIELEIKDAMAPAISQIKDYNKSVKSKLSDLDKSISSDITITKKLLNDSMKKSVALLPEALSNITLNIEGVNDALNDKVKYAILEEIKRNDAYTKNIIVTETQKQFKEFVQKVDFTSSFKK